MDLFKNERLKDYNPNIDPSIPLDKQNLQRKTFVILAMLNLNYWCEDEKEKQALIAIYAENDRKKEEELREKYNPDNLFKKKEKAEVETETKEPSENLALVEHKENNFLKKILNKIRSLFRRK